MAEHLDDSPSLDQKTTSNGCGVITKALDHLPHRVKQLARPYLGGDIAATAVVYLTRTNQKSGAEAKTESSAESGSTLGFLQAELDEAKRGFLAACKVVDHRLQKLNDMYNKELIDEARFLETQKHFDEKEIFITVAGRHNSGKSTLLNALLGNKWSAHFDEITHLLVEAERQYGIANQQYTQILPVKRMSATSLRVVIEHNSTVHQGTCPLIASHDKPSCEKCPRLSIIRNGDETVVKGEKAIHAALQQLNDDIRSGKQDVGDFRQLIITTNVAVLSGAPKGWNVKLADTPGFGENDNNITQIADKSLKASSAYVYVVNTETIGDATDAHYFQELKEMDEDAFSNGRLVVVITKFDSNYEDDEEEIITEEEGREKACDSIATATNLSVSTDIVIPLSGLWARSARELANYRGEEVDRMRKKVAAFLLKSPKSACGQGESASISMHHLYTSELARRLEEASGITNLERRIQVMSGQCVRIWREKMSADYRGYLKVANDKLTNILADKKEAVTKKTEALQNDGGLYEEIKKIRDGLEEDLAEGSTTHKCFQHQYDEDVQNENPQEEGKKRAAKLVVEFRTQCVQRVKSELYGPYEFQEDLEAFFKEAAKQLETTFNAACRFSQCSRQQIRSAMATMEEFTVMRERATTLCGRAKLTTTVQKELTSSSASGNDEGHDDKPIIAPDLAEVKRNVDIPAVTLGVWKRFKKWMMSMFKKSEKGDGSDDDDDPSQLDPYRRGDLDATMQYLKTHLEKQCDEYFVTIKAHVTKYFFDLYCNEVRKMLKNFDVEFNADIEKERRKIDHLQKEIYTDMEEVTDLEEITQHLPKLCAELQQRLTRP